MAKTHLVDGRQAMVVLRGLCLALGREREVGKLKLRALGISSDKISFFSIKKREGLGARSVSVDAHSKELKL